MPNIIRLLKDFNAGREPERLQMKWKNLRSNPFVFLRGTCHLFYSRLPREDVFASAPISWICGDLHLENFGSFEADNGLTHFDINDFDEAALAPLTLDLVRFVSSVQVGARSLALEAHEGHALSVRFIDAYAAALAKGKSHWVERDTAQGLVRELLDDLRTRDHTKFLAGRTVGKGKNRRLRVDGEKALPASEKQHAKISAFMEGFADKQPDPAVYKVLDVARRVAGTGSLGLDRYVILVQGEHSGNGHRLLDLRQAMSSSVTPHYQSALSSWKSEASRIVSLQQRLQADSMALLQAVKVGKSPYVLRALQPSEDRVSLDRARHSMKQLHEVMDVMGQLVAWAHLRATGRNGSAIADELIDFGQQKKWKKPLLATANDCAAHVVKDWKTFSEAFDDGEFKT
ncbi:MAG: DUF2252 family protein [Pseudomonadota bacterium]